MSIIESGVVYLTEDQTRIDYFYLPQSATDAPETGKVAGDFTITVTKDGTGDQSTTGITIAEVDSSNNPGIYSVTIDGSTSFIANTGSYVVNIYLTGDTTKQVIFKYYVGASNTYSGTLAEFTSSTSDGRVTAGGSPVSGANVIIRDGSNNVVTEVTTNAQGNFGPVYLTETSTVYVQESGYQQATATITVSGTSATGPGADITLTASSASNHLLGSNMVAYARREAADRSGDKSDTKLLEIVNEALQTTAMRLMSPYYMETYELVVESKDETGTLAVTNGSTTVTLSGATWSANAADGAIFMDSKVYNIDTRDSNTQVTLDTAYQGTTAAAKSEWHWAKWEYDLPDDMGQFRGVLAGMNWPYGPHPTSYMGVLEHVYNYSNTQKYPDGFAIRDGKLAVAPPSSDDIFVTLVYERRPAEITSLGQSADIDPIHLHVLRAAIRYHVALEYGTTEGGLGYQEARDALNEMLLQTSAHDRNGTMSKPPLRSQGGYSPWPERFPGPGPAS